ncbi:MAG: flippase [Thermodesulfobacteriota bacterium]
MIDAKEGSISSRLATNSLFSLAQTAIVGVFGLLTTIVLARMLGPFEFGRYSYLMWLIGVLALLASCGLPNTVTRYVAEYQGKDQPDTARLIYRRLLKFELGFSFLITVAFYLLAVWIAEPQWRVLLWISGLSLIPMSIVRLQAATAAGLQKYWVIAFVSLLAAPLQFGLLVLVVYMGLGLPAVLAVQAVLSLFQVWLFHRKVSPFFRERGGISVEQIDLEARKRIMRFATTVFAVTLIDAVVWQKSEVFFLKLFSSMEEVAFYSLAFTITYILMQVPAACSNVLFPFFSETFGKHDVEALKKVFSLSTKYLSFIAVPLGFGGVLLAGPLIRAFYGQNYEAAITSLRLLLIAGTLGTIARPASSILYSTENQAFILKVGCPLAVVNILLDLWLIPSYGAIGAAVANDVAQLSGFGLGIFHLIRNLRYDFPVWILARIGGAALVAFFPAYWVSSFVGPIALLFLAAITCPPIYIGVLRLVQAVDQEDLLLLKKLLRGAPLPLRTPGILLGRFFDPTFVVQ